MKIKRFFTNVTRKTTTLMALFAIGIISGSFIYISNARSGIKLSDDSVAQFKTLNQEYGFALGEDLFGSQKNQNALTSLLKNDVLQDFGSSEHQGLILHVKDKKEGTMILMTPEKKITEEDLWGIAEKYEAIPEINFAEPDVELEIFSIDESPVESVEVDEADIELSSYSQLHRYIVETVIDMTLPKISQSSLSEAVMRTARTRGGATQRNKWWEQDDDTNHSFRARLHFAQTDTRATIGVLDSGMDVTHQRFQDQVWKNIAERAGNQVDDDSNQYVDDIYGWDFTQSKGHTINDTIGHGTHVTGIVAKYSENPIAALKVFDRKSESRLSYAVKAIRYGTDNHMRVLNVSFGTTVDLRTFREIVEYAEARGTFIVAAAGNNNSSKKHYPAAYDKVISVGALDADGDRLAESNYGDWVDVSAPGERVLSTIPGKSGSSTSNRYGYLSGTSQSAPFVTAAVANMVHENPNITIDEVKTNLNSIDFTEMSGPHPNDVR